MNLYPAIDLKDGACVRLLRGDMDKATVFNNDPGAQAGEFVAAGCHWVHIVDLNGALPVNRSMELRLTASLPQSQARPKPSLAAVSAQWKRLITGLTRASPV